MWTKKTRAGVKAKNHEHSVQTKLFVSESKFSSEDPYVCTYDVCENSETTYCVVGELNTFLQHYDTDKNILSTILLYSCNFVQW